MRYASLFAPKEVCHVYGADSGIYPKGSCSRMAVSRLSLTRNRAASRDPVPDELVSAPRVFTKINSSVTINYFFSL